MGTSANMKSTVSERRALRVRTAGAALSGCGVGILSPLLVFFSAPALQHLSYKACGSCRAGAQCSSRVCSTDEDEANRPREVQKWAEEQKDTNTPVQKETAPPSCPPL